MRNAFSKLIELRILFMIVNLTMVNWFQFCPIGPSFSSFFFTCEKYSGYIGHSAIKRSTSGLTQGHAFLKILSQFSCILGRWPLHCLLYVCLVALDQYILYAFSPSVRMYGGLCIICMSVT